MTSSIYIVIHIAVTAGTGVGGIALLGAGGGCHHRCVTVGMATLPDLNILDGAIIQSVGIRTDVGEGKVFSIQPVGGGLLVGGADVIMVHSTDLSPIYIEPDHVGAVVGHPVLQAVSMQFGAVDAVIAEGDTVVVASGCGLFAHGDQIAVDTLENVAGIVVGIDPGGGKQPSAAAAGILPGALALPFHNPGLVMAEDDSIFQRISGGAEYAAGGGTCLFGQSVAVLSNADQVRAVELPAVRLGLVLCAFGGDGHVCCDRFNGHGAVFICGSRDVLAAHSDGDGQLSARISGQGAGESVPIQHQLVHTVVRGRVGQDKIHGIGSFFGMVSKHRFLKGFGIGIHAKAVWMYPSVANVGVKILLGDAAVVDVHDADAKMVADFRKVNVKLFQKRLFPIGKIHPLGKVQIVDLCLWIAHGNLVQHNGGCFQRGGGGGIGIAAVAVVRDQSGVVDIGGAQRRLIILIVIGAQLDADDVGFLPGVVSGIVMELDTTVHISAHGTAAGVQQRGTGPGIVDQQLQPQVICSLHPPGIVQLHITDRAVGIILHIICNGRIGRFRCRAIGSTGKGRNAGTKDGDGFACQSGCWLFFLNLDIPLQNHLSNRSGNGTGGHIAGRQKHSIKRIAVSQCITGTKILSIEAANMSIKIVVCKSITQIFLNIKGADSRKHFRDRRRHQLRISILRIEDPQIIQVGTLGRDQTGNSALAAYLCGGIICLCRRVFVLFHCRIRNLMNSFETVICLGIQSIRIECNHRKTVLAGGDFQNNSQISCIIGTQRTGLTAKDMVVILQIILNDCRGNRLSAGILPTNVDRVCAFTPYLCQILTAVCVYHQPHKIPCGSQIIEANRVIELTVSHTDGIGLRVHILNKSIQFFFVRIKDFFPLPGFFQCYIILIQRGHLRKRGRSFKDRHVDCHRIIYIAIQIGRMEAAKECLIGSCSGDNAGGRYEAISDPLYAHRIESQTHSQCSCGITGAVSLRSQEILALCSKCLRRCQLL